MRIQHLVQLQMLYFHQTEYIEAWGTLGVANLGSGEPWEWRTLGVVYPGSGEPWEWRTLGVASRHHHDHDSL